MKKRYRVLAGVIVLVAVVVFVVKMIRSSEDIICHDFRVVITTHGENEYVTADELMAKVKSEYQELAGTNISDIDFEKVRNILASDPFVRKVVVYKLPDASVKAEVEQREPLVRIFNSEGKAFMIDMNGDIMPVPPFQSLSLICASGQIHVQPEAIWGKNVKTLALSEDNAYRVLNSVYLVALGIYSDESFSDLISQLYVNSDMEIELIPAIGNFCVYFGMPDQILEKLNKLYIFYTKLFPYIDMGKYKKVDLTIENQLVLQKIK